MKFDCNYAVFLTHLSKVVALIIMNHFERAKTEIVEDALSFALG